MRDHPSISTVPDFRLVTCVTGADRFKPCPSSLWADSVPGQGFLLNAGRFVISATRGACNQNNTKDLCRAGQWELLQRHIWHDSGRDVYRWGYVLMFYSGDVRDPEMVHWPFISCLQFWVHLLLWENWTSATITITKIGIIPYSETKLVFSRWTTQERIGTLFESCFGCFSSILS